MTILAIVLIVIFGVLILYKLHKIHEEIKYFEWEKGVYQTAQEYYYGKKKK